MPKIIIANWKMRLGLEESLRLAQEYVEKIHSNNRQIIVCPSEFCLIQIRDILNNTGIKVGAQNVFWEGRGAYTGEIAAEILEEIGVNFVIIGHSERRQNLLENYQMIHQKIKAVLGGQTITPIICVGETLREKENGRADYVITEQLQQAMGGVRLLDFQKIIIAYEPIWAIGTGQSIKPADARDMHEIIHASLVDIFGIDAVKKQFSIIYGGSVDINNIKEFTKLDNVDGFLVGTASLNPGEFADIIACI